ncbi:MAG: hypothetical protein U5L09_11345 [Bacteroidales bacterium]|nr:hypothetical protein [Bacteroidales bacterium]
MQPPAAKDDFGEVVPASDFLFSQQGVFIINEGNFSHNNGSISLYSFDSAKVYSHVFLNTNKRPPGDIPNHMALRDTTGLIVINNASRIEFVNSRTFNSRGSLQVGTCSAGGTHCRRR